MTDTAHGPANARENESDEPPAAMLLPALVGDVLELDLASRRGDQFRGLDNEAALTRVLRLVRNGEPVPAEDHDLVGDVIELDLEDRRGDVHPDPDAEQALAEVLRQLRAG
jgi:hypothetical protein